MIVVGGMVLVNSHACTDSVDLGAIRSVADLLALGMAVSAVIDDTGIV